MTSIDDLELELRKLPGVRAAGFDPRDDLLVIQLHVASARGELNLPVAATRIAAHHSDRPVAVEIIRWREQPPTRPLGPVPVESAVSPEPVEAPDVVEHLEPAEPAEPAEAVEPLAPTEPF